MNTILSKKEKYEEVYKQKNNTFGLIFSLLFDSFWKSFFGPFFAFVFPLIFVLVLGFIIGYDIVLGGAIGISTIAISLTSMPQDIFEFKRSSLLKRLGATPVKPYTFLLVTGFFYFVVMFVSFFWTILFSFLVFGIQHLYQGKVYSAAVSSLIPELRSLSFSQIISNVNWLGLIWGELMAILIGSSCGLFLVSVSKSTIMIQSIGITIVITSLFLSCQVLPPSLAKESDVLWYAGYVLSPFRSSSLMILESWNGQSFINDKGTIYTVIKSFDSINMNEYYLIPNITKSNIFDISSPYFSFSTDIKSRLEILSANDKLINLFIPFIWIIFFGSLAIWKFRWSIKS